MSNFKRGWVGPLSVFLSVVLASCGGNAPGSSDSSSSSTSSSTSSVGAASNVVSVSVDAGPSGVNAFNTLYTTVTVCVPGSTTECQTIDNVQVDTGSYGLRILSSVLTLALPTATAADGNSLVECTQFVDGYSWGPVATADLQISGESAHNVPLQVIGTSTFTNIPVDCSSAGLAEDTVESFGANGIIGIGVFAQDCGATCAGTAIPGAYYSCTTTTCNPIAVPLTAQVPNPVTLFATDNNGTIIELPSVAADGAATVTGSLIFGIDTETNNASGAGGTVLTVDPTYGTFTTVFNGTTLNTSFIDSGTNGIYFNDSAIAPCTSNDFADFYCPSSTLALSATLTGDNNVSASVNFNIGNAQSLFDDEPTYTAFASVGGTYSSSTTTFDWGLPFFYGRNVYNAIQGYSTSAGAGPYVAF